MNSTPLNFWIGGEDEVFFDGEVEKGKSSTLEQASGRRTQSAVPGLETNSAIASISNYEKRLGERPTDSRLRSIPGNAATTSRSQYITQLIDGRGVEP